MLPCNGIPARCHRYGTAAFYPKTRMEKRMGVVGFRRGLQIYKFTNTQVHKYINAQIHKYTNTQLYRQRANCWTINCITAVPNSILFATWCYSLLNIPLPKEMVCSSETNLLSPHPENEFLLVIGLYIRRLKDRITITILILILIIVKSTDLN